MRTLLALIEREFWEHRALWLAPVTIAVVLLAAVALFGHVQLGAFTPPSSRAAVPVFQALLVVWSAPFYIAAVILTTFYLLDCLYGERRDRSVLFWRSLPVSDTQTVLVKLLVGIGILPFGTMLLVAATSLVASAILVARNHLLTVNGGVPLWNAGIWLRMQGRMLYSVAVVMLWYVPYAAYLLLASVWARRSPALWAFIPPVLLAMIENMTFGTHYLGSLFERGFGTLLGLAFQLNRQIALNISGVDVPLRFPAAAARTFSRPLTPMALLLSAELWVGLAAAAVMLWLTIWLRRHRDES